MTTPIVARRSMMCAATLSGDIYFFGGVGSRMTESILDVDSELWSYSTSSATWRRIQTCGEWPSPRRCAGFVALGDDLYLWGGSGIETSVDGDTRHNFLNDLWVFHSDADSWDCVEPYSSETSDEVGRPGPRYTPNMHFLEDRLFVFGGYTETRNGGMKLNDAWLRQQGRWVQALSQPHVGYSLGATWPGVRYGAQSATDGHSVYIFGGFSDDGDHNDLWQFSDGEFRLVHSEGTSSVLPRPRYCAAFDFFEGRLWLFGGRSRRSPKENYSDLWTFDLEHGQWTELHGDGLSDPLGNPTPGYHAKSSVAVVDRSWYLWGGEGPHGHVSDFWSFEFDELRWTRIAPARTDDPHFW